MGTNLTNCKGKKRYNTNDEANLSGLHIMKIHMNNFIGKNVVVTEKMDGENTSLYNDHIHARSINSGSHVSRNWVKGIWGNIGYQIPEGWRLCGENLYAKHTVEYNDLKRYFLLFSIWDEKNCCLSWKETKENAYLLDIEIVPVLYEGIYDEQLIKSLYKQGSEGYVIRLADSFEYKDFRKSVAKYVSPDFVLPHGHWSSSKITTNGLKANLL
jgi:hypothetical protein